MKEFLYEQREIADRRKYKEFMNEENTDLNVLHNKLGQKQVHQRFDYFDKGESILTNLVIGSVSLILVTLVVGIGYAAYKNCLRKRA